MGDRWQPLPEFIELAVGTLIVVGLAVGAVLLAQSLGASGELFIGIAGVASLIAAVVIARALRS